MHEHFTFDFSDVTMSWVDAVDFVYNSLRMDDRSVPTTVKRRLVVQIWCDSHRVLFSTVKRRLLLEIWCGAHRVLSKAVM